MKKRAFTLIALCVLSVVAYCATIPKPGMRMNTVSGELGGNGLFLSVNYGRVFAEEEGFVLRVYLNPLKNLNGVTIFNDYEILPYLGIGLGYAF